MRAALYAAALAALLAAWQVAALVVGKPYLPPPAEVAAQMASDSWLLAYNLLATLRRIAISALIALVLGIAAGLSATWLPERVSASFIRALVLLTYPVPHLALTPIFLHLFGIEASKIAIISLIALYPIALSVMEWAQRFPRDLASLIYVMGGGRRDVVKYVVLPSSLPGVLTGVRIAVSTAYSVSFIAESLAVTDGLGALIYTSWHRLEFARMYAAIVTLSAAGLASYALLAWLERRAVKWA
jgi:NitT/TauT family transport system permease protein